MRKIFLVVLLCLISTIALAGNKTPPPVMGTGPASDARPMYEPTTKTTYLPGGLVIGGAATTGGGYTITSPAYGVRWNVTDDTYAQGVLVNGYFTPVTLTDFPVQAQMRRVVLSDAGAVQYYLCPTDSTKKADCSTASVLDGTDGQVMVQIPVFHYLQCQFTHPLTAKKYRYFLVSTGPFVLTLPDGSTADSAIHPAFYKGGSEIPSDYRYISAYEGTMYDASASAMTPAATIHTNMYAAGDKMCSVSGQYPKTMETRAEYRAMATVRGSGWHQYGAYDQALLSALFVTEYGSLRSQLKIGNGRTALSGGTWIAGEVGAGGYIGITGLSNGNGNATGNVSVGGSIAAGESGDYMSYRGIENWWGNVYKFLDGINVNNSTANGCQLYLSADYTAFADNTAMGYALAGNLAEVDGYSIDIIDAVGIWPASVGGSSSTYLADYYYTYFDDNHDSGWQVVRVGGGANASSYAGAFCVYSVSDSSDASAYIAGRLSF